MNDNDETDYILCVGNRLDGGRLVHDLLSELPLHAVVAAGCDDELARAIAGDRVPVYSAVDVQPLRELSRAGAFVLIGFAWEDPELELLLELVLDQELAAPRHFAALPAAPSAVEEARLARCGVGRVDPQEAASFLRGLRRAAPASVSAGWDAPVAGAAALEPEAPPAEPEPPEPDPPPTDVVPAYAARRPEEPEPPEPLEPEPEPPPTDVALDGEARVAALLDALDDATDAGVRAELLEALARIFTAELDDADRALTALLAAFGEAPHAELLHDLERLARATERWDDLAEALAEGAPRVADPRGAGASWLLCGEVFESRLGDATQAAAAYRRALDADRSLTDAFAALELLHRRLDDVDGIIDAIERWGDRREAIRRWADPCLATPRDGIAVRVLEGLLAAGALAPEEEIACRLTLQRGAPAEARFEHLVRIGDLYRDALEDPHHAAGAYRAALAVRPDDRGALHRCLELATEQKQWRRAVRALDALIRHERRPAVRARYHVAAAQLWRDELDDPDRALQHLQAAVEDDPRLDRADAAIERLLRQLGRWHELARHYARALERLGPETADGRNGERLRLYTALGRLNLDVIGQRADGHSALTTAARIKARAIARCSAADANPKTL